MRDDNQATGAQAPPAAGAGESTWSHGLRLEAIANLAHELRTPVQVLLGYLDILREDFRHEFSAEPLDLLERMNANAHDLAQTIENIMHFVLTEVHADVLVDEDIRLRSLMVEIAPPLEAANQRKHLRIDYDLKNAPETVRLPHRALRSILLNLALNSIKFTEAGAVTIAIRRARGPEAAEVLEIEVSDTGPGMSPAVLEQAATPFYQLSNTSARRHRGVGLGLSVVKRTVGTLGGRLEMRSSPARGSTFIVTIPMQSAEARDRFARAGHPARKSSALNPVAEAPVTSGKPAPTGIR